MDDRRFDSLVKSLADGASRRSVLKGLLGLGSAAALGGTLLDGPAEAARRPTLTPRPITCPGQQIPIGGVCTCPGGTAQCNPNGGPACCPTGISPGAPGYSECCDNACCQGICYGEELCCATNSRPGELPPTHGFCDGACVDLTVAGNCCDDGDCGNPCQVCNHTSHTCVARCDARTQVCCTEQAGPGVCVTGACCLGVPDCGAGRICCQSQGGTVCVEGDCCADGDCPPIDACTTNTCQDHLCTQTPVDCDDGDACTFDFCNPLTGCFHRGIHCDDSNPCTVNSCDPESGCVFTPVDCDDGNPCTNSVCDPAAGGCVYTAIDCSHLDDPERCLEGVCNGGVCSARDVCGQDETCLGDGTCGIVQTCVGEAGPCQHNVDCCAGCCIANLPDFDDWVAVCISAGIIPGPAAFTCAQAILDQGYPLTCRNPPVITFATFPQTPVPLPCTGN